MIIRYLQILTIVTYVSLYSSYIISNQIISLKNSRTCYSNSRIFNIKPDELVQQADMGIVVPLNEENQSNQISKISPDVFAIITIYFVQGAIGLSRLAITYFMKDTLHLSPSDLAMIQGINTLPWVIKPLYGLLSDGFPIFGYKRRSYLILSGIMGSLSWLSLGTFIHDSISATVATTLGSASIAISDVVADSLAVEKSRLQTKSKNRNESGDMEKKEFSTTQSSDLQSLCWSASATGGIMSAYFSGSLLQILPISTIFYITAIFPLLVSLTSLFIQESKEVESSSSSSSLVLFTESIIKQTKEIWEVLKNPSIYLPVLFVFLWQATPSAETAMFYFSTNVLHFPPEFLGRVRLLGNIASLVGVIAYRTLFKNVSIKDLILWTTLASVPLSLTQILLTTRINLSLGIPDQLFALTETTVLTALGQLAFMPTLVLAASLCPPGVEGTLFATLMSIFNAAGSVSSETGAWLTSYLGITENNFDNLSLLVSIASLSSLLPLVFIRFLDKSTSIQSDDIDKSNTV